MRQALRLVGECRDLGSDAREWFAHACNGARQLLGAKVVMGTIASAEGFDLVSRLPLVLSVGWDSPAQEAAAMSYMAGDAHLSDPSFQRYQQIARPNIILRPLRLVSRRAIETSEYHAFRRSMGVEDIIFSQRHTANRRATFLFSPQGEAGGRPFRTRDVKLMRLLHDELSLLVGNVLADGFVDPLAGLPPRHRQTLTLLLTGDSEKMMALRMGISRHTVHEYVVELYRYFRVNSRAGLMALCRQRGIGPSGRQG